jgi:hypothetical protein
MGLQCLFFPERLVAWRVFGAIKLGFVDVPVSLQPAVGCKALSTAMPIACKGSRDDRIFMGILQMSLQMVFSGECFVAANLGAGKWSLLVVASHVRLETAWPVEALFADIADVVPLAACLALRPHFAVVGVVDLVVARVV